jgi:hypothetical protein
LTARHAAQAAHGYNLYVITHSSIMTKLTYPWPGMRKVGAAFSATVVTLLVAAFASPFASAAPATLAESPALACLTRVQGASEKPEYPQQLLDLKYGGTIPVKMVFRGPDKAPKVEIDIDKSSILSNFEYPVRDYVAGFRVPCMKDGDAPVTLHQNYVFTPNDGRKVVIPSAPVDEADAARSKQFKCMTNISSRNTPEYPRSALRDDAQGKFYINMRFDSPDLPPTITWLATAQNMALRQAVEEYVANLRIPCLEKGPIESTQIFNFFIAEDESLVLRDMTLRQFIGAARGMSRPAVFDLNSMDCPFDLRISHLRPYAASKVGELEKSVPARKPFIDWISTVTLKLGENDNNRVLGDEFTLSVPCGRVNL